MLYGLSEISGEGKTNYLGIFSLLFFSLMFVSDMTLCVDITIVFIRITEKYQQALHFNAKYFV